MEAISALAVLVNKMVLAATKVVKARVIEAKFRELVEDTLLVGDMTISLNRQWLILNQSSAVENFGEETKSLGNQPWTLEHSSVFIREIKLDELLSLNRTIIEICRKLDYLRYSLGTMYDTALGWCKKISAAGNKMTIETSSKGGFDIEIGSYTVHVPKYSSVHQPIVQMMLFACALNDSTLRCLKFLAPKSIVEFNESGLVITKTRSHSPNTLSARKDMHVLPDTALENHSITPGLDKNIPKAAELEYNLERSTVHVHSEGFELENTYNLHSFPSATNSADHGIAKAEEKGELWKLANTANAQDKTEVAWLMATAALHHATGNRDLLSGFTTIKDLFVKAGDGVSMPVCGRGSVITGTVVLPDVWFVPGLTENLVSAPQLTELDYSVGFARGACIIRSATDGVVIGKAHASEDGLFKVEFLNVQPSIAGE